MSIQQLASSIASRNCVLFVGSGLTADSGGLGWDNLIEYLKNEFNYSSVLTSNFDIIEDLLKDNEPKNVYYAVQKRLEKAVVSEKYLELIKLPWYATFTTNYDLALEKALEENQSLPVRVIVRGNEFQLDALQSEILCVKLMGSLDINYREPGSMVFDKGDISIAQDERYRIFDILASHAANKKFFFFGYSFEDDLFLITLAKLTKILGYVDNTYYALFRDRNSLTNEKIYKLKKNNVKFFIQDPEIFIQKLSNEVLKLNPMDLSRKRIQIKSQIINIDTTKIGFFLSHYYPVFFDEIEDPVSPRSFFDGNTNSLKPFDNMWHYPRKEIEELIELINMKLIEPNCTHIFTLSGYPGTGRTFIINATINRLIREYGLLAIKIPDFSINTIPGIDELSAFINEILDKARSENIEVLGLIFFSHNEIKIEDIFKFNILCNSDLIQIPLFLLFESNYSNMEYYSGLYREKIQLINVIQSLGITEKKDLQKYLKDIIRIHRFPEVSDDDIDLIIKEEKEFLPIIYRILDPAKRSINKIIETRYHDLLRENSYLKDCISLCALSSFFNIPLPISVLKNSYEYKYKKLFTYPEILEFTEKAGIFIKVEYDSSNNIFYSIYHNILSNYIDSLNGTKIVDEYLCLLASSINLKIKIESDFFRRLFIENAINLAGKSSKPFSNQGIIKSIEIIKQRQPARPVIHHLARLYDRMNINQELILPLLDEALREPVERYELIERIENIQTTKASVLWNQNKDDWSEYSQNAPEIISIIELLISAQNRRVPNPHAYDVHARVLRDLSRNKDEEDKFGLICEAIDILNEGIEKTQNGDIENERLKEQLIECFSEVDENKAEETAKNLLKYFNDGTGYYTLARIEYHKNKNYEKSLSYLNLALNTKVPSLKVIDLKIEILVKSNNPSYFELLDLADGLSDIHYKDTIRSSYNKAVIYFINGYPDAAIRYFTKANRLSLELGYVNIHTLFWMENGHRKIFRGKIHPIMQIKTGSIYSHDVPSWKEDIYFQPNVQRERYRLKTGLSVTFELGFNLKGPIAFELKPYSKKF